MTRAIRRKSTRPGRVLSGAHVKIAWIYSVAKRDSALRDRLSVVIGRLGVSNPPPQDCGSHRAIKRTGLGRTGARDVGPLGAKGRAIGRTEPHFLFRSPKTYE